MKQNSPGNSTEIFESLKNLTQASWFKRYGDNGVIATWLNKFSVPFSLIVTRWGICFDFNMIQSSQLLNVNETSSDFHYVADVVNLVYIASLGSNALDRNESFPWAPMSSKRHLIVDFYDRNYVRDNPFEENSGFHLIVHSPNEFPFDEEKNHVRVNPKSFLTFDINPVVYEADSSLLELDPEKFGAAISF